MERKGRKITTVDMSEIDTAAARRFIICEGTSTQHVAAVADSVREYLLEKEHIKPYNYDGYGNSQWIVIDYGDTLVHVFSLKPEVSMILRICGVTHGLQTILTKTDCPSCYFILTIASIDTL